MIVGIGAGKAEPGGREVVGPNGDLLYRETICPEEFEVMARTFDAAWSFAEARFAGAPTEEIEAVRTQLARSIVQTTREGLTDAKAIRRAALGAIGRFAKPPDADVINDG